MKVNQPTMLQIIYYNIQSSSNNLHSHTKRYQLSPSDKEKYIVW